MNDLDLALLRLDLEADTARATQMLLDGRAHDIDAMLAARDYVNRRNTYKQATAER